eukprot:TRINITY_DN8139_c0_g1_i1.p1 TRINITY_DN8139_c0_g1~~TRINITY_DN8139_c0_g1_i1.p1  ORF type:complete len:145 (+),score=34.69 TRINITY_DN8139_c0_g1_i1:342-776(+)
MSKYPGNTKSLENIKIKHNNLYHKSQERGVKMVDIVKEDINSRTKRSRKRASEDFVSPPAKRRNLRSSGRSSVNDSKYQYEELRKEHKRDRKLLREQVDQMHLIIGKQNEKIELLNNTISTLIEKYHQAILNNVQVNNNPDTSS